MGSAGDRGIIRSCLQMLHVHVLLIAERSACHMAEFGIDQHQSRVPIWECLYHAGSGVRLTIQPYNRVVVDMHPVFAQEDTVS